MAFNASASFASAILGKYLLINFHQPLSFAYIIPFSFGFVKYLLLDLLRFYFWICQRKFDV